MAATNKCLAQSNKSGSGSKATKERSANECSSPGVLTRHDAPGSQIDCAPSRAHAPQGALRRLSRERPRRKRVHRLSITRIRSKMPSAPRSKWRGRAVKARPHRVSSAERSEIADLIDTRVARRLMNAFQSLDSPRASGAVSGRWSRRWRRGDRQEVTPFWQRRANIWRRQPNPLPRAERLISRIS
jgi:hypothetical protein